MDEHDLMTALEERADDVVVGPAPLDAMTRSAGRTRRRRGALAGIAAAAVVAVAAVGVAQVLPDGTTRGDDGTPVAVEPGAVDVPPAGSTYVALGRAAIAVPKEWPAGDVECNGVPKNGSTYVVDRGNAFCAMFTVFPDDTDAVSLSHAEPDTSTWAPVQVDGVEALRSPDEEQQPDPSTGASTIHGASVYLPEQDVVVTVQSTVSAEAVGELLDGIVVLDEHAGVPGFADLSDGTTTEPSGPLYTYLGRLEAAGLQAELVEQTDRRRYPRGTVISVDPVPGTIVEAGSTVRVTAAP